MKTACRGFLAAALAACVTLAPGQKPATEPHETTMSHDGFYAEYAPALAKAQSSGKDLLIEFGGSDWCEPCRLLKEHIMTKPAFYIRAEKQFECVDIDDLYRGLSAQRKKLYLETEKKFNIHSFPSVILATPDGVPYGWTTYSPAIDTPEKYWHSIQPLITRGNSYRSWMKKAESLSGRAKAGAIAMGMSEIRPDLLWHFDAKQIATLRTLDPSDKSGLVRYLDAHKEVEALENKLGQDYNLNKAVTVGQVDALCSKYHLKGEMAQQADVMKAVIYTAILKKPKKALDCFADMVNQTPSRFDRAEYIPLTEASAKTIKKRIAEGMASQGNEYAENLALHRIFELDLPDRYQLSCHGGDSGTFRPAWPVRMPLAEACGTELLKRTSSLRGEARAKALANGLEGTQFLGGGSITEVIKLVSKLVGSSEAAALLPTYYKMWVPQRPASAG